MNSDARDICADADADNRYDRSSWLTRDRELRDKAADLATTLIGDGDWSVTIGFSRDLLDLVGQLCECMALKHYAPSTSELSTEGTINSTKMNVFLKDVRAFVSNEQEGATVIFYTFQVVGSRLAYAFE